jgi:hypothetical protein
MVEVPAAVKFNVQSALRQSLMTGRIIGHLEANGYEVEQVNPNTLASALQLGKDKGREAKKQAALEIARAHGLPEDRGDDEADAACLAAMWIDDAEEATT